MKSLLNIINLVSLLILNCQIASAKDAKLPKSPQGKKVMIIDFSEGSPLPGGLFNNRGTFIPSPNGVKDNEVSNANHISNRVIVEPLKERKTRKPTIKQTVIKTNTNVVASTAESKKSPPSPPPPPPLKHKEASEVANKFKYAAEKDLAREYDDL